MASAVDMRLLEELRAVFDRNSVALGSIQPRLMAAYNNCRTTLHKRSACLCCMSRDVYAWACCNTGAGSVCGP